MLDLSRLRDLAISDTGFVFDPLTGYTYSVNDAALAMVQLLKAGQPPDRIVTGLRDRFEIAPDDDLARDVDEFMARLRELGLIR